MYLRCPLVRVAQEPTAPLMAKIRCHVFDLKLHKNCCLRFYVTFNLPAITVIAASITLIQSKFSKQNSIDMIILVFAACDLYLTMFIPHQK